MQGLAKILVIEDDAQARINLSNILEFVGEPCEAISSDQFGDVNWSALWAGCIVGSLADNELPAKISSANHIPLLIAGKRTYSVDELTHYVGELEYPLNYPQLSEAIRHCKDFLGRKGSNVVLSERKNTLFRSLVGQSSGIKR